MLTSANRSNHDETEESARLVSRPSAVNYKILGSYELFVAIGEDKSVLADETILSDILRERRDKETDFIVAVQYLRNVIPPNLYKQLCSTTFCNTDELLLLTELSFRVHMMQFPTYNERNTNRCVALAEQLERSSSRARTKGVAMTVLFPVIVAGMFAPSFFLLGYLGMQYHLFALFPDAVTYISTGISLIGSIFSGDYAIDRLNASSSLNNIFLATHEFFFAKNNIVVDAKEVPELDSRLKSEILFQTIEIRGRNSDLLQNNQILFSILNSRKNKKLDLLAALSYLDVRYSNNRANGYDAVRRIITELRSIVYNGNLDSTELTLLTELTYRMTRTDDQNKQRCLEIVGRLEKASSSWTKAIVKGLVAISCLTASALLLAALATYTSPLLIGFGAITLMGWGLTYMCNGFERIEARGFSRSDALASISRNARAFFASPSAEEKSGHKTTESASTVAVPLVPLRG